MAITMGSITLTLGALVLAACFHTGPLYGVLISTENFSGRIVNAPNIGALVAGVATLMSFFGRKVAGGLSRAWLRRRAIKGQAITVKQWKTLSAGISVRDARRTPFLAGGLVLVFIIAMGFTARLSLVHPFSTPGRELRLRRMGLSFHSAVTVV